MAALYSNRC